MMDKHVYQKSETLRLMFHRPHEESIPRSLVLRLNRILRYKDPRRLLEFVLRVFLETVDAYGYGFEWEEVRKDLEALVGIKRTSAYIRDITATVHAGGKEIRVWYRHDLDLQVTQLRKNRLLTIRGDKVWTSKIVEALSNIFEFDEFRESRGVTRYQLILPRPINRPRYRMRWRQIMANKLHDLIFR